MTLKYCSLTGADDEVSVDDLNALAAEFPFVEWAILLLPARAGDLRFPSIEWIHNFSKTNRAANTAMHLCDGGFLGFINGDKDVLATMNGFKRIQLNLKFGDVEGKYDPAELIARVRENPHHQFIIQYTKDKSSLLPLLADVPNHAVLFDESAGRGISPDSWDCPLPGHFCGYAGGITPENVAENIAMIQQVADGHTTWIDMESGVRTNDHFDLEKCRSVLKTASPFVTT